MMLKINFYPFKAWANAVDQIKSMILKLNCVAGLVMLDKTVLSIQLAGKLLKQELCNVVAYQNTTLWNNTAVRML